MSKVIEMINHAEVPLVNDTTAALDQSATQIKDDEIKFQLVSVKSLIDNPVPIRWTIKGFLEKGGMNLVSGAYGSGKSFVAFDMAFCTAAGIDWHGNKVIQSPVVILAGEGHSGIADRFAALEIKYGVICPECLYVSQVPAKLTDSVNAEWVGSAVNQICPDAGMVIIDTLNRNFGGLDENSTKDMTMFINNVDGVFRTTGKTVMVVHHTGHAENSRARGSSTLPGACEGEFIVAKQVGGLSVTCIKQKNAAQPEPMAFRFKSMDIDGRFDDDDEQVTSLVLEYDGDIRPVAKKVHLSPRDDLILASLLRVIDTHGVEPTPELKAQYGGFESHADKHKKVAPISEWKKAAYPLIDAENTEAKQKAFKRAREKMVDLGKVRFWNDYWWPIYG